MLTHDQQQSFSRKIKGADRMNLLFLLILCWRVQAHLFTRNKYKPQEANRFKYCDLLSTTNLFESNSKDTSSNPFYRFRIMIIKDRTTFVHLYRWIIVDVSLKETFHIHLYIYMYTRIYGYARVRIP